VCDHGALYVSTQNFDSLIDGSAGDGLVVT
jgi:hypothetical protein